MSLPLCLTFVTLWFDIGGVKFDFYQMMLDGRPGSLSALSVSFYTTHRGTIHLLYGVEDVLCARDRQAWVVKEQPCDESAGQNCWMNSDGLC